LQSGTPLPAACTRRDVFTLSIVARKLTVSELDAISAVTYAETKINLLSEEQHVPQ